MKNFFKNWSGVMVTLGFFIVLVFPILVSAANPGTLPGANPGTLPGNNPGVSPSGGGRTATLLNPLGGVTSFCQLIINLLNAVMVIGIPIAILFIVWAGFKFVLAQGNAAELGKARQNFLYVVIGIAIFVGASLIASVILHTLQGLGVEGLNSCAPV